MKSREWLIRQSKDVYVKNAKNEGYLSRAAFKLIEIEKKFKIITKSERILELGASPGSWSQVICEINENAHIDAFDILNMKFEHRKIKFFKEDILNFDFKKLNNKYDLILSDIAPNTTGHKSTDHLRIVSLIEDIILIINDNLSQNGNFIFKLWSGSQNKNILNSLKNNFKKINNFKPKSSRSTSSEIYIIAKEFIL